MCERYSKPAGCQNVAEIFPVCEHSTSKAASPIFLYTIHISTARIYAKLERERAVPSIDIGTF